jgi:hypothetical protein
MIVILVTENNEEMLFFYLFLMTDKPIWYIIYFWYIALPLSIWRPGNLIYCFMRCFERLLYCVEYSMCPHYFIPEINMFENKIEGHERQVLLEKRHSISSFLDWLHPIGTKRIPWSIILDFSSLLGQEVLGLVTHLWAGDIHCLEWKHIAKSKVWH